MLSSSPSAVFNSIAVLLPALLMLGLRLLILAACVFGAMQPSLRREFIWFTISAVLGCLGGVLIMIPQVMFATSSKPSEMISQMKYFYTINSGVTVLSMLLAAVGFVLLALRSRSLPVMRN